MAAKQVDEAISKIVDAHIMIEDKLNLQVDLLSQKTKSQWAMIQDFSYTAW